MSISETMFEQLQASMDQDGVAATLDLLADQLRSEGRYHELFAALKMRMCHDLGLPLQFADSNENLDDSVRDKLEEGLLSLCREVGLLLLGQGQIGEGWMYLRPVGDNQAVADALTKIDVDEDNIDEMIQVTLHEGVDTRRGFGLVLEQLGTCNAITTFEQVMPQRSRGEQSVAAAQLLEHLHAELTESVRADIARQSEAAPPEGESLAELVAQRDWLFADNSYHVDTTHLASVVRFSRLLEDPEHLRLALDLTEYGRRLGEQFRYAGDPPFEDLYPSHALFLRAILGERIEEAVAYFREQAEQSDMQQQGPAAVDAYVDLLARLGRNEEAIEALIALTSSADQESSLDVNRSIGFAPSLLQLSGRSGDYGPLMDYCLRHNDLLGYANGLTRAETGVSP